MLPGLVTQVKSGIYGNVSSYGSKCVRHFPIYSTCSNQTSITQQHNRHAGICTDTWLCWTWIHNYVIYEFNLLNAAPHTSYVQAVVCVLLHVAWPAHLLRGSNASWTSLLMSAAYTSKLSPGAWTRKYLPKVSCNFSFTAVLLLFNLHDWIPRKKSNLGQPRRQNPCQLMISHLHCLQQVPLWQLLHLAQQGKLCFSSPVKGGGRSILTLLANGIPLRCSFVQRVFIVLPHPEVFLHLYFSTGQLSNYCCD